MKGGKSKTTKSAKVSKTKKSTKSNSQSRDSDSEYDFTDVNKYRIPDMNNYNSQNSFLNSVHKIMISHSMIPKSIRVNEFVAHQDADFKNDIDAD